MIPTRLVVALVVVASLLHPAVLRADDAPPFTMSKQYSADMAITSGSGFNMTTHTSVDGDKARSDMQMMNGMAVSTIIRKDKKKIYHVLDAQKMVMESDFDPAKMANAAAAVNGPQGKFELVGPDTVDGVAATKYKVTAGDGKINYFWLDPANKAPLEMASGDGAYTIKWKNFKAGPQDPALFEPPAGYQVMNMPSGMGMPGGSPPGGAPAPGSQ
jgi:hypothetical protein